MEESGADLAARLRKRWAVTEAVSSAIGAVVVYVFVVTFHRAAHVTMSRQHLIISAIGFVIYLGIGMLLAWRRRGRRMRAIWRWLEEGRSASPVERDRALREPLTCVKAQALLWAVGAIVFGGYMFSESVRGAFDMILTIVLGGMTTGALTYLGVERLLRPVTARALAGGPPERPVGPGVPARLILTWALASGLPLMGIALLAVEALGGGFVDVDSLALVVLIVAALALGAGAVGAALSARSLSDPLAAVRKALSRVQAGDLDAVVTVDDASEVGLLQAGFNQMTAGLRDRERLRDLFGRHVGEQVARRALADGVSLGGEVREVAALFVDLVGSTKLASRREPETVVEYLNRFFAIVIEVVEAHGGLVNKFEGDAALCVFGAPATQPHWAAEALAAARDLGSRLRDELAELDAGIGLSAGAAVAGNIGVEHRLEYTVIGDPVNEAARLCELAKREPGRVLASAAVVSRSSASEAGNWRLGKEIVLRGRPTATRLAMPAGETQERAPQFVSAETPAEDVGVP